MLQIPTKALILLAAFIWLAAGASVISAGVDASEAPWTPFMGIAAFVVFVLFLPMFLRVSSRHIKRITSYAEPLTSILKVFDTNSYVLMAVMIGLGAFIRLSGLVPGDIIEFFYAGLGSALVVAAVYDAVTYIAVCDELAASQAEVISTQAENIRTQP